MKDPAVLAAVVSAGAAWVAAWFAIRSASFAKKTYGIAEAQQQGRQPQIVLYLVDGYIRPVAAGRIYAFSLLVSNTSDSDNSISRLELVISYRRRTEPLANMALPHDAGLTAHLPNRDVQTLPIPCPLPAHQTAAGWALFTLPDAVIEDAVIEGYIVTVSDSHGLTSAVEPIILHEIVDEEEVAKEPDTERQ